MPWAKEHTRTVRIKQSAKLKAGTILALIRGGIVFATAGTNSELNETSNSCPLDLQSAALRFSAGAGAVGCPSQSINQRNCSRRGEFSGDSGAETPGERCDRLSL